MPHEKAVAILASGEYGVLSTVSPENIPYGVPLNYCFYNDSIYFHSALEGRKLDNIAENERVSFCVVGNTQVLPEEFTTKYESCIVSGVAREVFDDEKVMALECLVEKYSPRYRARGREQIEQAKHNTRVMKIVLSSITGKANRQQGAR